MRAGRLERLAFSLALVFFGFLYGWGAGAFGWFPGPLVTTAFRQAEVLLGPTFLVPAVHGAAGVRTVDPSSVQPGVTLVSTMWPDGRGWTAGLRLVDTSGEILHQ